LFSLGTKGPGRLQLPDSALNKQELVDEVMETLLNLSEAIEVF
jgi:hypothetical protein